MCGLNFYESDVSNEIKISFTYRFYVYFVYQQIDFFSWVINKHPNLDHATGSKYILLQGFK